MTDPSHPVRNPVTGAIHAIGQPVLQAVVNVLPELDFDDPTPIEVPIKIGGKRYLLREATETVAVEWQNSITSQATFDDDGKPKSMGNLANARPKLLSRCLLELRPLPAPDNPSEMIPQPVPVPEPTIRSWPSRITVPLYDKVMEMSQLGGKDTEESLEKKIKDAQTKLDKLRAAKRNDPDGKLRGQAGETATDSSAEGNG